MDNFKVNYYFNFIDEFEHKAIFDNTTYAWDVLANVKQYIQEKVEKDNVQINNAAEVADFVSITGNYIIGEGTTIHANAVIQGPVIIGKNVEIQSGALVRPWTIIGDNCVVGHGSEIKHSVLFNKAKVASLAFVGDSVLGKSVRIGSGIICANRRFDQKNITVKNSAGEKVDVGTDFFGLIMGDMSRIGANSTTLPGSFIGSYTWVLPTCQIRGFVPSETRVFSTAGTRYEENPKVELK